MTVSGTATFNQTASQICRRALRQIGAIQAGETPNAAIIQDATDALNAMVKQWQASGIHVWTEEEAILFLEPGQSLYQLGATSTDNACDQYSWTQVSLATTALTSATTLTVSSIVGLANGDNFGVTLDSGTIFWTTVNGTPSGATVHIASGLPSQASAGANCFDYATKIIRPLRIPAARRYQIAPVGGVPIETPLIVMSRSDYMDLPNKQATGIPTQFFYSPKIGSASLGPGLLYVWPNPANATQAVRFTWYRPLDDFTTQAQTPDFPQEWINCLTWNLAVQIGPEYDIPPARWQILVQTASAAMEVVSGWDREPESILMGPSYDPTAR